MTEFSRVLVERVTSDVKDGVNTATLKLVIVGVRPDTIADLVEMQGVPVNMTLEAMQYSMDVATVDPEPEANNACQAVCTVHDYGDEKNQFGDPKNQCVGISEHQEVTDPPSAHGHDWPGDTQDPNSCEWSEYDQCRASCGVHEGAQCNGVDGHPGLDDDPPTDHNHEPEDGDECSWMEASELDEIMAMADAHAEGNAIDEALAAADAESTAAQDEQLEDQGVPTEADEAMRELIMDTGQIMVMQCVRRGTGEILEPACDDSGATVKGNIDCARHFCGNGCAIRDGIHERGCKALK